MTHILIIDDEEAVRSTFQDLFEDEGYNVTLASDGNEGIAAFNACPADVVVTDLLMPNKEGIETIVELRKKNPDVGIIAVSGGGAAKRLDFLEMAKKLGADLVIPKPFDLDELSDAVRKLLRRGNPANRMERTG